MGTIEVILRGTSSNLGTIKAVNRGYARYLISQKKALPKTKANQSRLEAIHQQLEQEEKETLIQAQTQAKKLDGLKLEIQVRATEEKRLYGSLGAKEIAQALSNKAIFINKKLIKVPTGSIHQLGEYDILIHLHPKVNATVTVHIMPTTRS